MRVGENNRTDRQSTTIFSITERKTGIQILASSLVRAMKKAEARASGCGKFSWLRLGKHWGSRGNKTHCFPWCQSLSAYYYSLKISLRFWLVKTTRIIYHNQLTLTKFGKSFVIYIEPMTSRVQPAADYWTDDVKMKKRSPLHIEPLTRKTWQKNKERNGGGILNE